LHKLKFEFRKLLFLKKESTFKNLTTVAIDKLPLLLLGIGAIIRLRQYLTFRSFWLDESFLVLNLRDKSYTELLQPLDYSQVAPIGFVFSEKFFLNFLGLSEWGLRLFPLLASLASLWIVYKVAIQLGDRVMSIVALAIFIMPTGLTYYASEVKQYSTDVFFCLLAVWCYLKLTDNRNKYHLTILAVVGVLSIWFSSVSIIYILSILAIEFVELIISKRGYLKFVILSFVWLIAFSSYYYFFINGHPGRIGMERYWHTYFMPQSMEAFKWLLTSFNSIISDSFAYNFNAAHRWIIALLIILGVLFFNFKSNRKYLILILPIAIHLFLSLLKLYPFGSRLILYQMPLVIILIAGGLRYISLLFPYSKLLAVGIYILISYYPANQAFRYFIKPFYGEHMRASLKYINQNKGQNDGVYVFAASKFAFDLYKSDYFTDEVPIVIGEPYADNRELFEEQYGALHGNYWILFSHEYPPEGIEWILNDIKSKKLKDHYQAPGSQVFLVEF
jgi:hypothetical protein